MEWRRSLASRCANGRANWSPLRIRISAANWRPRRAECTARRAADAAAPGPVALNRARGVDALESRRTPSAVRAYQADVELLVLFVFAADQADHALGRDGLVAGDAGCHQSFVVFGFLAGHRS